MMLLLKFLLLSYLWAGITFMFFVAIITIKTQWTKLSLPVKIVIAPWGIVGLLSDVILNLVFSWFFLLSPPKEFLFTKHCDRLLKDKTIQGKLARTWCRALDLFQQGGHCHAD